MFSNFASGHWKQNIILKKYNCCGPPAIFKDTEYIGDQTKNYCITISM